MNSEEPPLTQAEKNKRRLGINVGGGVGFIVGYFLMILQPENKDDPESRSGLYGLGLFMCIVAFFALVIANIINETLKVTNPKFTQKQKQRSRLGLNIGGSLGFIAAIVLMASKKPEEFKYKLGFLMFIFSVGALFLGNILNETSKTSGDDST